MVAGIKGVVYLNDDEVAVSSSTEGEIFVVSISREKVVRSVKLGTKVESLSVLPSNPKILLVAEADGTICRIDLGQEPAVISCAATADWGPTRLTSVAAYNEEFSLVAGAEKNNKLKSAVWVLHENALIQPPLHECCMVRALYAEPDKNRCLIGSIETSSEEAEAATTTIFESRPPFKSATPLGKVLTFVHSIARKGETDIYVFLTRHGSATAFEPPVKLVRLPPSSSGQEIIPFLTVQAGVLSTLPITMDGIISRLSFSVFMSLALGRRTGREHAMALHPDGNTVITGNVDKASKGILQLWNLHGLLIQNQEPPEEKKVTARHIKDEDMSSTGVHTTETQASPMQAKKADISPKSPPAAISRDLFASPKHITTEKELPQSNNETQPPPQAPVVSSCSTCCWTQPATTKGNPHSPSKNFVKVPTPETHHKNSPPLASTALTS